MPTRRPTVMVPYLARAAGSLAGCDSSPVPTDTPLARRQRRIRAGETPTERAAPAMSTVPVSYSVTAVRSASARICYDSGEYAHSDNFFGV